ncbi:MAG: alpha/beta hydrolase [Thermoanaerobaculaceae bacterium]
MIVLIAIVAAVAAAGVWAVWMLRYRPLTVFAWQTRLALRTSGLHKVLVAAPAGPQTVFAGGGGPVLVLLHGAGGQAGAWFRVTRELAKTHRLIVPDLAGHGASAPMSGPIEVRQMLEAAEAVVGTLANGERVTLVGNSLGAWIAMLIAHRHPERVAMVVCIDGGAIRGPDLSAHLLPKNRSEARESLAQTRDSGREPVPGFVLDDIVRQARTGPLARFAATAASMEAYTLSDAQLHEITVPVRLVWGASDRLVPIEYAQRMLKALPDATLVTLDRCGHVPPLECPDAFLTALNSAVDSSQSTVDSSPTHPGRQ